jgi:hypothetical protein
MPVDRIALEELAAQIGRFYIRDRRLRRAQDAFTKLLASGKPVSDAQARRYVREVRRYFVAFEREARAHLGEVERRLAKVSQVQFNLSAERGVAARRVEVTQGVLARVENLAPE